MDQFLASGDRSERELADAKGPGRPLVDMADPQTGEIFQNHEQRNLSVVSDSGQMLFDDPYVSGGQSGFYQQIETELQSVLQELQQINSEIGQLAAGTINDTAGSASTDSPSSSSSSSSSGGDGAAVSVGQTSGSGPESAPVSGSGESTITQTSGSNPDSTSPPAAAETTITANSQPGSYSAITPDGSAAGSTATKFGISAMPTPDLSTPAFYVSATDGSADGNGSAADPFANLQEAQQAMQNSNIKTTFVESGTYNLTSALDLSSADSGESFIADDNNGAAVISGGGTANQLFNVNGANNVSVEGFTMENTQTPQLWTSADWAGQSTGGDAVWAENSTGDNFSFNTVSNTGMAFDMLGVSNSALDGNDISNVGQAINLTPNAGGWNTYSDNDTISGNRVENVNNVTGVAGFYPGAIQLLAANNDTASQNVVENTAGAGINIADAANGDITANDDNVTGNTVINTNTAASSSETWSTGGVEEADHPYDMGGIYVAEAGSTINQGINISDNYVKDAGPGINNNAIYLDAWTNGANVTNNIVDGDGIASDLQVNGGSNNTVANNVFDQTSVSGNETGVLYQNEGPQMVNNVFQNNIFYANGSSGPAYNMIDNANDQPAISGNDYYGVSVAAADSNPQTANPQFTDPANGDYAQPASVSA